MKLWGIFLKLLITRTNFSYFKPGKPRTITFRSAIFRDEEGRDKVVNICVHVEDGDVLGIFNAVMEKGGVGEFDENGNYVFVPWPCACVEISDIE
jgi:hypothetical protein